MTHRQMVILSPQRGITVNREQMEAHLALFGWEPFQIAQAGAIKGNLVVMAIDRKGPHNEFDGAVEVKDNSVSGLNLQGLAKWGTPGKTKVQERTFDSWYMSDKYFWPLAHRCVELDNQG